MGSHDAVEARRSPAAGTAGQRAAAGAEAKAPKGDGASPDVSTAATVSGHSCLSSAIPGSPAGGDAVSASGSVVSASWTGAAPVGGDPISSREKALRRRNIRAMLTFQFLSSVAWGAALGPVFDRYLLYLGFGHFRGPSLLPRTARNSLVGATESISGLSSLFLAIPVGLLVDRYPDRRARVLRFSCVFGVASVLVLVVATVTDVLLLLYAALILLGVFSELSSSATEAIFADSIPQGERSGIFVTKAIICTVGTAIGPLLSAVGLSFIGDEWEPYQMKAVIVVGSLLLPLGCGVLFFFQDPQQQPQPQPPPAERPPAQERCPGGGGDAPGAALVPIAQQPQPRWGPLRSKHIPFILAFSDFLTCVGAGMTVKFFNLFFIQDKKLSPTQICMLQTAYPLVIAVFMKFSERLAKPLGRAQASLTFFSLNVVCLFLLSHLDNLPLLIGVFLVRGGFANSTYPIDRSILMDFTPSEQRGRWNAVESLTSMTWSGSAFVGGLLSDTRDYRFTFLITAFVYATACATYAPLLALVPRREEEAAAAAAGDAGGRSAEAVEVTEGGAAREAPLLAP